MVHAVLEQNQIFMREVTVSSIQEIAEILGVSMTSAKTGFENQELSFVQTLHRASNALHLPCLTLSLNITSELTFCVLFFFSSV
jgi:hypothetical protein